MASSILLPAGSLRTINPQPVTPLLRRSRTARNGKSARAALHRKSSWTPHNCTARTPKAKGVSLSAAPKTPRSKKASRWLQGRRDATLRLAHRSADVASATLASALHVARSRKDAQAGYDSQSASTRSSSPDSTAATTEELPKAMPILQSCLESTRPMLADDFGFASASLCPVPGQSELELRILARDAPMTDVALAKLLGFAELALYSKEASRGFVLCCDLRELRLPKMSTVSALGKWSNDPQRKEAFRRRCRGGKICVQSGLRFRLAKSALTMLFKQVPLSGPAYLVTSLDGKSEKTVAFGPSSANATAGKLTTPEGLTIAPAGSMPSTTSGTSGVDSASQNLWLQGVEPNSISHAIGQRVASACGGCFAFLGASLATRHRQGAKEVDDLRRTVQELTTRIRHLEHGNDRKGKKGIIGG